MRLKRDHLFIHFLCCLLKYINEIFAQILVLLRMKVPFNRQKTFEILICESSVTKPISELVHYLKKMHKKWIGSLPLIYSLCKTTQGYVTCIEFKNVFIQMQSSIRMWYIFIQVVYVDIIQVYLHNLKLKLGHKYHNWSSNIFLFE